MLDTLGIFLHLSAEHSTKGSILWLIQEEKKEGREERRKETIQIGPRLYEEWKKLILIVRQPFKTRKPKRKIIFQWI